MPLTWSEVREANEDCSYTHVVAETPLGRLVIEWKGWKDHDPPTCILPWGEFIIGMSLSECKEMCQAAWDKIARAVAELSTPEQSK